MLEGALTYESDQVFETGVKATLKEGAPYDLVAEEDSVLMLIEPSTRGNRGIEGEPKRKRHKKVRYHWYQLRDELLRSWKLYLFVLGIWAVSLVAAYSYSNNVDASISSAGIGIASSLLIFFLLDYSFKNHRERNAKVWKKFSLPDFISDIKYAENTIRIYSTYSHLFDEEESWEDFKEAVLDRYSSQDAKRLVIEILLLDPNSYAAKQRNQERDSENIIERIENNIENLDNWINHGQNKKLLSRFIQVRVTDSLPRHQHHQIDETINFAFYPQNMAASEASYLRCSSWTEVGKYASQSFEEVWHDRNVTVSLNEYVERKRAC